MTPLERNAQARQMANFLATLTVPEDPLRVGEIAAERGCPVPVRNDHRRWPEAPGSESHCQRVRTVLQRAVRLGLVKEWRNGSPQSGPIYYSPIERSADETTRVQADADQ